MILADSAVWIPFVTGEISLGSIATRDRVIAKLGALPRLAVASPARVATLIENAHLWGLGIGYVDTHLLASALLTPGISFWTRDKRLRAVAARMGIDAGVD